MLHKCNAQTARGAFIMRSTAGFACIIFVESRDGADAFFEPRTVHDCRDFDFTTVREGVQKAQRADIVSIYTCAAAREN